MNLCEVLTLSPLGQKSNVARLPGFSFFKPSVFHNVELSVAQRGGPGEPLFLRRGGDASLRGRLAQLRG